MHNGGLIENFPARRIMCCQIHFPERANSVIRMSASSPPRHLWPLMALACAPDGVLSPVQMQKALFLVTKRAESDIGKDLYEFKAHYYGPFSADIYRDINALQQEGRADLVANQFRPWKSYGLTQAGRAEADKALAGLNPKVAGFLKSVVEWVVARDFPELLRAVYAEYPDYAVNSVFQKQS